MLPAEISCRRFSDRHIQVYNWNGWNGL